MANNGAIFPAQVLGRPTVSVLVDDVVLQELCILSVSSQNRWRRFGRPLEALAHLYLTATKPHIVGAPAITALQHAASLVRRGVQSRCIHICLARVRALRYLHLFSLQPNKQPQSRSPREQNGQEPKTILDHSNGTTAPSRSLYLLCLLYTSPSPRDRQKSRMPSSA